MDTRCLVNGVDSGRVELRPSPREIFVRATEGLVERGWFQCGDFTEPSLCRSLVDEARQLWEAGSFRAAAVGRGADRQVLTEVRGDSMVWLDPHRPTEPQRELWELLDEFRSHLNRELFLSLRELELQYAAYAPGQRYQRHVDQFEGVRTRLITVLLYLNPEWRAEDGGQLRVFNGLDATEPAADVLPRANTFVCFRSELIPHEVLPPQRLRFSVGGWLRVRTTGGGFP